MNEQELFSAATKIDVADAVYHIRDWRSYIDVHHRQKYADLIEAQAKLIAHLIQSRDAIARTRDEWRSRMRWLYRWKNGWKVQWLIHVCWAEKLNGQDY